VITATSGKPPYEHRDDATFFTWYPIYVKWAHVRGLRFELGKGPPRKMMWTPGARSIIRKGDDVRFERVNGPGKVGLFAHSSYMVVKLAKRTDALRTPNDPCIKKIM
jgi:hypothetical protein